MPWVAGQPGATRDVVGEGQKAGLGLGVRTGRFHDGPQVVLADAALRNGVSSEVARYGQADEEHHACRHGDQVAQGEEHASSPAFAKRGR
jgi:hypothetical protein